MEGTRAVDRSTRFGSVTVLLDTHFLIWIALGLASTRDPFDRMLVAHSLARGVPLCTADREIRRHHRLVATE